MIRLFSTHRCSDGNPEPSGPLSILTIYNDYAQHFQTYLSDVKTDKASFAYPELVQTDEFFT